MVVCQSEFLLQDCSVHKTELTFKIPEIVIFFSSSLLACQSRMVFSVGGVPKCRSAALFPYAITVLSIYSPHHNFILFFPITKLATNKNIVLLPITQITLNSSSLARQTAMTHHRLDLFYGSGFVLAGQEGDSASKLVNPCNSCSLHQCTAAAN